MKNIRKRTKRPLSVFLILLMVLSCTPPTQATPTPTPPDTAKRVKIGLLLDTSNSMDGLINQAKSQLWDIVNELAKAKCDGVAPELQIALYEYGNSTLPASEGYIRMVTPLTSDLDQLSKDLFSLTTNGGDEFCGQVIKRALDQLDWGQNDEDLKLIFIAGNEPFTQGRVSYQSSCSTAKSKGVTINTIFCGNFNEGINTKWKHGADLTSGYYMSIEQNRKTVYISSPYDDKIEALNTRLNRTYIPYGNQGARKREMQVRQDSNAESISKENKVKRAVSKSSTYYKNSSWDLVDAVEEESVQVEDLQESQLPPAMKGMSDDEKKEYVDKKQTERSEIKKEIQELNKKREVYVQQKKKESGETEQSLDKAMLTAIRQQAKLKNFKFEE